MGKSNSKIEDQQKKEYIEQKEKKLWKDYRFRLAKAKEQSTQDEQFELVRRMSFMQKLRTWNVVLGFIHAVAAGALLGVTLSQPKPLETPVFELVSSVQKITSSNSSSASSSSQSAADVFSVSYQPQFRFNLQLAYLVIAFFAVTSIAHFLYASDVGNFYEQFVFEEKSNGFRWVEYAVSSTLMILVVAVLSGIRDIYALSIIMVSNTCIMLLGRQIELSARREAEKVGMKGERLSKFLFAFLSAWLLFIAIWLIILLSFGRRISEANQAGADIPLWIYFVQIPTFFFFASFGIINLVQIYSKKSYETFELTYTIFSLLSKLFLGIWIGVGIFQSQTNQINNI